MPQEKVPDWERIVDDITDLYRDVEKRSLSLPLITITPFFIYLWNVVKFVLFFYLDIVILIPMNAVILVRNLFPGKWRYRSFSWKYIKYVAIWVWRGEAPYTAFIIVRPLVRVMLTAHVHSRLQKIKRYIYIDDRLSEEQRQRLTLKIDRALIHWGRPRSLYILYAYVLPISGPAIEGYKYMFPEQLPVWIGFLGAMLLSYVLAFAISAFMVKRALMLGATGRAVYFPGAIEGSSGYLTEKRILESTGIRRSEFPVDLMLILIVFPISYLMVDITNRFYESMGIQMPPSEQTQTIMLIYSTVFLIIIVLVLFRRKVTGRL